MSSPRLFHSLTDRVTLGRARGEIAAHRHVFDALVARAVGADDPVAAAAFAQIAADWGWRSHTGLLTSVDLELLLARLGREHAAGGPRIAGRGGRERVLHVLTEAYDTGGHTRVVERWVDGDTARDSTIVLTGQTVPVPESLRAAKAELVPALGGGDLLARARILRAIAREHDLVVLHAHMHDVLPALAFADPDGRPPTVLFNHASHCLWLGAGVADVVANLWEPDDRNTRERRGFPAERSVILPLPVATRALPSRLQARAQLSLDPDVPVFLAVGSGYKVQPILEPPFSEVVAAVLAAVPAARMLLVGPSPEQVWTEVNERVGGRLEVMGTVADIAPHLAAADVLLDTWPASGATTLVDAAAAGLPILSLGDGDPAAAVVRPPAGTLGGAVVNAASLDELTRAAAMLARDPAERERLGRAGRAAVADRHAAGWIRRREAVVEAARANRGVARPPAAIPAAPVADWECVLYLLLGRAGAVLSVEEAYTRHLAELPETVRPAGPAEIARDVAAILAVDRASGRRAFAEPAVEPESIQRLVEDVRALCSSGAVASCTVAVPVESLEDAVALLERALEEIGDVDLELVLSGTPEATARPDDLVLA
jgi:glycosyltransferase involved in cell wall biosynthesis